MNSPRAINSVNATYLVAKREVLSQVKTKSFLISTAILLVVVFGSIIFGSIFSGGDSEPDGVAVVEGIPPEIDLLGVITPVVVSSIDEANALVRTGEVSAAIIPDDSLLGYSLVALDEEPQGLIAALSVSPTVELLEPPESSPLLRYIVSIAFGAIFMMMAMAFGSTIAQNTIVEKQTRTVELLLSAIPARALLAGKIVGNSILAFGQMSAIAAVIIIGLVVTGQEELLGLIGAPLLWFLLFFVVGFLLIASIFAASASLVSRIEDSGTVLMPVMMLVMLPYFIVILFGDNQLIMSIASYFPFSAPVAMPVRLFTGTALWWEPLLSLLILLVSTLCVVLVGERIYAGSLLQVGRRLKIREALSLSR